MVFTDLVGSTELRRRLGEEDADDLRRAHDEALSAVVARRGGEVVKSGGDGLMCLFDAASDALSAATEMQRTVVVLGERRRLDLRIRVGLSVGDVTLEDGDCFGMPVVEASRLEAAASAGQVLCSALVRAMARGRGDHELVSVGALELKGIDEPVEAFEVRWEAPEHPAIRARQTPFVGREPELELIGRNWESAVSGLGGSILVSADAGMGKSRLLSEFVEVVAGDAFVLAGTCHEGDSAPYAPIADAVTRWAETEPERAAAMLGPQAAVLTTMAPGLLHVLPDVGDPPAVAPQLVDKRLLDSWERILIRCSGSRPTLLVLDDLHWADQGTVALMRVAMRVAGMAPLMVVAAYRGAEIVDGHPLFSAMGGLLREGDPKVVELEGLDATDVRAMLEEIGGGSDVAGRFVDLLTTESGGNPLFIRETLLHLVAEGRLRREGDQWVSDGVETLELPDVLRHVIGRRLDRLSESARDLLTIAALFDAGFPLAATCDVADVEEATALDAIDEALAAELIEPGELFDTYRFTHAMFRHALANTINPSRRARLHRRVAESLAKQLQTEPTAAEAAVIAQHYAASADLPGAEVGVAYALVHGDTAMAGGAHLDALDAYRLARYLLPVGDERAPDVQRRVAEAAALGRIDADSIVAEAALVAGDVADRADTAAFLVHLGRLRESEDVLTSWRIGELARPLHSGERDDAWVSLRSWELAERDWRDPTASGFPTLGPERRELMDVATRLRSQALGLPDLIVRDRDEAVAVAASLPPLQAGLMYAFQAGMYREAIEPLTFALDSASEVGDTGGALFALASLGRVHFALGNFDEADRLVQAGELLVARLGDFSNPVLQYAAFVEIAAAARDQAEARQMGEQMRPFFDALSPDLAWYQAIGRIMGVADCALDGDLAEARRQLGAALDATATVTGGTPNLPFFLGLLAEVCDVHGIDPDPRLADRIERQMLEPGFGYVETDPEQALGILAGLANAPGLAVELFRRSRATLDANGNIVMRALTPYYEARMEYRTGFPSGAARFDDLIAEARSIWSGMAGFEGRVASLDELVAARDSGEPLPLGG